MRSHRSHILAFALLLAAVGCGEEPAPEESAPAALPVGMGAIEQAPPPDTVDLAELGYERGSPDAPVTVTEFSDFGCPYCSQFALQTYPDLHREFVETGQVRWRYVPFTLGIFPNGDLAALTAHCAGEQDRFWEMHDLLFEAQRAWKGTDDPDALFADLARRLNLDPGRFSACYREARPAGRVELANQVAGHLGVRATPTFFVNGQRFEGALPPEQFRMLLQWSGAEVRPGP